jgi:hypothetical protein
LKLRRREEKPKIKLKRRISNIAKEIENTKIKVKPKTKLRRRQEKKSEPQKILKLRRREGTIPSPPKLKLKLRRRNAVEIYCNPNYPVCYVCGEKIEQEYVLIKRKQKITILKGGHEKEKIILKTERQNIEPLMVGQNKMGINLYRHRSKKRCMPMSKFYMERFSKIMSKDLLRAYTNGQKYRGEIQEELEEDLDE